MPLRVESVACLGGPQVPSAQPCSLLPWLPLYVSGCGCACVSLHAGLELCMCAHACAHLAFVLYEPRDALCLCTLWLCVHVCKCGCGCGTQAAACSFCLLGWALVLRGTGVGLRRGCWLAEVAPASRLGNVGCDTDNPIPWSRPDKAFSLREQGQHCLVPGQTGEPPASR